MKSLSIKQPWASLIADGKKTIEVRTWKTNYRGDFLIVSSATPKNQGIAGHAIAIATLSDCRPAIPYDDDAKACCDVYENDFAWILTNIRKITPFPVKGKLNFYEVAFSQE